MQRTGSGDTKLRRAPQRDRRRQMYTLTVNTVVSITREAEISARHMAKHAGPVVLQIILQRCARQAHLNRVKKVHIVDYTTQGAEGSDNEELSYAAECISTVQSHGLKWFAMLQLNNKRQACQLDSGATCNVMGRTVKERLSPNTPLRPSTTELKLYSRQLMRSLGRYHTDCYQGS